MQNFQKLIKLPQLFLFLLGNAFVAYSYQGFVSANDFLSGGTYGMAGIVTYFLDFLPFSLVVLLFNLPCIIWAWRELEKRFVVLTAVALLLQVVFLQLFEGVVIYNNDLLLAAIFAGVFVGGGDALVLRSGSGSSGVHLVAMVLRQKYGITVSTVTTSINAVIILLSTGIFGIEKGLYTLILIFASGQTLHAMLDGLSRKRTAFIITSRGEEVGAALMQGLHRGVTLVPAVGLYSHTDVSLLMCVTNMLEVGRLKTLVQAQDPYAFITFYETTDFSGHFLRHNIIIDREEDDEAAPMPAVQRPSRSVQSAARPAAEEPKPQNVKLNKTAKGGKFKLSSLSHMGRKQERKSDDKQQAVSQPVAPVEPAPEAAPASARPKPRPADSTDFAADIASRLVSRYVANVDKIERKDDFWEE